MENLAVVKAEHLTVRINNRIIIHELSFVMQKGEQWVITGNSGTGKTTLLHVLYGKQYFQGRLITSPSAQGVARIAMVEQQHHFRSLSNVRNFYYQQRFNSSDSEDAITVHEDLQYHVEDTNTGTDELNQLVDFFHLGPLLEERLIQLSNGENKRLQIAKAILDKPDILLLDNPFTGLDTNARLLLEKLLSRIAEQGILIVMVSNTKQLPAFVTHVLTLMEDGKSVITDSFSYLKESKLKQHQVFFPDEKLFTRLLATDQHADFNYAVKMTDIKIAYHEKNILDGINWQVKKGDRWSLSGPNGAGKSTLLSLITADNPQAYANNIFLFDRKRGSGETIWEIKKKIGYISPELHLHFEQSNNCFDVVASGLFDTIGLFRQLNDQQVERVDDWMKLLEIDKLRSKMLFNLSNSEQRMVLLARALVKNPPMLVLDEPCQGLDEHQVERFKELITQICIQGNKTLIYVSHYPEEIPECVDKFIKLENGKVAE